MGHLNLLRRSKSRCEYLIAGVLTDELFEHFKKRKPVIPYEQRAAIVSAHMEFFEYTTATSSTAIRGKMDPGDR